MFNPLYLIHLYPRDLDQVIDEMKEVYVNAVKDLPPNALKPREKGVHINCFVDTDHRGDKVTRHSKTGIILYGNSVPLIWYLKRQNTVESSTFRTEFVALRIATELFTSFAIIFECLGSH